MTLASPVFADFFVGGSGLLIFFFFFNDTATTEIYTLSLHDALPISVKVGQGLGREIGVVRLSGEGDVELARPLAEEPDRKSTRLNSSHVRISYAVFCLKKKKNRK